MVWHFEIESKEYTCSTKVKVANCFMFCYFISSNIQTTVTVGSCKVMNETFIFEKGRFAHGK
jgi:hypothetical protein